MVFKTEDANKAYMVYVMMGDEPKDLYESLLIGQIHYEFGRVEALENYIDNVPSTVRLENTQEIYRIIERIQVWLEARRLYKNAGK